MQETGSIIYFLIIYLFLMVFLPAKVLRLPMGRKQIADSAVKALLVSYTVCISLVYGLGLLHIYNRYTLILGLVLTLLIYGFVKKVKFRKIFMRAVRVMALIEGGQYRVEVFIKDWFRKIKRAWKESFKSFVREMTVGKGISFLVGILLAVIWFARRMPAFFGTYAYRTSDMYVHHEWINYMEAGNIFYDGIYPFGMHNMISALHLLSGLNLNLIFRYYGAVNCFLIAAAAVYFLCRTAQTKVSILIYMAVYGMTNFGAAVLDRMSFTLPQECAMPFILICLLFLGRFLESRKKEDGIYFSLAASLVLSTHFFAVIFAVILCGSLVLVYLPKIWKEKLIFPLFRFLILILCISTIPFLIGKLEGKYWQGSMTWALGVMTEETSTETGDELKLEGEGIEEAALEAEYEEAFKEQNSKAYMLWNMIVEKMYAFWGYVFWGGMIYAVFYFLVMRKHWKDWRQKQLFAVWLTLLLCVVMIGYWILGIPRLMKEERIWMFVSYLGSVLLTLPFETLAAVRKRWGKWTSEVMGLAAVAVCFYVTYGLDHVPEQTYFYLETSTAAQACVKIAGEYRKNSWTVVSPVEELSLIRGMGYHYELWEFITDMERYEPDRYLEIPTKYVFFILEKNPVIYNDVRIIGEHYDDVPIDRKEADTVVTKEMLGISADGSMKYYNINENRRALEAKLEAWLEAYKKMFPDQISVYLDSDDCVVYRLEQNEFALNNLAIDYGYNVITDEEYEIMLSERTVMEEEEP